MSYNVATSLGTVVSISAGLPATEDGAGYAALSWTVIAEVTAVPEFGATFQEITHTPLDTGIVQKFKGSLNNGNVALAIGRDPDDVGQALLKTASASFNDKYSFRVALSQAGGGGTQYFQARVMSYTTNPNDANSIIHSTATVGITSSIVEVAPA